MEEKLKIIDSIMEYHPSEGIDLGLSYYVGGMTDSGGWYLRKMLGMSIEELQGILFALEFNKAADKAITEQNRKKEEERRAALTQEDRDWEDKIVSVGGFWTTNKGLRDIKEFVEERERKLFFGAFGSILPTPENGG